MASADLILKAIGDVGNAVSAIGKIPGAVDSAASQVAKSGSAISNALNHVEQTAQKVSTNTTSVLKNAFSFALGGAITAGLGKLAEGVGGIGQAMIGGNADFEAYEASFATLMGSVDKAHQHIQDLGNFAAKTPFELPEVIQASKNLLTFGGQALDTAENLTTVGNAAAATGNRVQDVSFWFGRMNLAVKSGQAFGEPLQNLLQLGVISGDTSSKLEKLQKAGASTDQIWKAFTESMVAPSDAMDKLGMTATGLSSTLSDTFGQIGRKVGKPFFDLQKQILVAAVGPGGFLSSDTFSNAVDEIASAVQNGVDQIVGFFGRLSTVAQQAQPIIDLLSQVGFYIQTGAQAIGTAGGAYNFFLQWFERLGLRIGVLVGQYFPELGGQIILFSHNLSEGLKQFTPFVDFIANNFTTILTGAKGAIIGVIAVIGGMAIIPPIIAGIGAAIAVLTSPITLLVVAAAALGAAWATNFGDIQGKTQAVINAVTPLIQQLIAWFQQNLPQALSSLGATFSTALAPIQTAWNALVASFNAGGITAVLAMIQGAIQTTFGSDAAAAFGNFVSLVQAMGAAFNAIGLPGVLAVIQGAITTALGPERYAEIMNIVNIVQNGLAIAWQVATAMIQAAVNTIGPMLLPLFSQLSESIGPFVESLLPLFAQAWQALGPLLLNVAEILGGVLVVAFGIVVGAIGGLITGVQAALPNALAFAQGAIQVFVGVLQVLQGITQLVVGVVVGLFTGDFSQVGTAVQTLATGVLNIWQGLMTAIPNLYLGMANLVIGFVTGFVSTIIGFFTNLYNTLVGHSIIPDLMNGITTAFSGMIATVVAAVVGFVADVIGFFTNLYNQGKTQFDNLQTAITTAISTAFTTIQSTISSGIASIQTAWSTFTTGLSTAWDGIWKAIITTAAGLAGQVLPKINSFVSTITGAITGTNWAQLGNDIVQGIINGVGGMAQAMRDAAANIAGNFLGALRSAFESRSPSKKTQEIGEDVGDGLIVGLDNRRQSVINAGWDIATATIGAMGDAVTAKANDITQAGTGMITTWIDSIATSSDTIAQVGGGVIGTFTDGMIQQLDTAGATIGGVGSNIIDLINNGAVQQLNTTVGVIGGMGKDIVDLIHGGAVQELNTKGGVIGGLGKDIVDIIQNGAVQKLNTQGGIIGANVANSISGSISTTVDDVLPDVVNSGAAMVGGLGKGITQEMPTITLKANDLVNTVGNAVGKLPFAINKTVPAVSAAAGSVATAVTAPIDGINLYGVGSGIMGSLIDGIGSRVGDLQKLLDYIRGFFPSSPAKRGPFSVLPNWDALIDGIGDLGPQATAMTNALMAAIASSLSGGGVDLGLLAGGSLNTSTAALRAGATTNQSFTFNYNGRVDQNTAVAGYQMARRLIPQI